MGGVFDIRYKLRGMNACHALFKNAILHSVYWQVDRSQFIASII